MGRMNRSYLTGRRVKSGPTKVGLVTMRFQPFWCVFLPVLMTLNISSSDIPLTLGKGTANRAAFSDRLFLMDELSAFLFGEYQQVCWRSKDGYPGSP